MDRQVVKVYVRAGAHEGERTLSFKPPREVRQADWLRRGFAIDGNSVIASVTALTRVTQFETLPGIPQSGVGSADIVVDRGERVRRETMTGYPKDSELHHDSELYTNPEEARAAGFVPRPLVMALQEVEEWLVDWLGTLGYDVEFA